MADDYLSSEGGDGPSDSLVQSNHEPSTKRKRNRSSLNCTNCKQRKIKCSRQIPCQACIKRDMTSSCRWDDASSQPSAQAFALDSTVEQIRANLEGRIAHLEGLLTVQTSITNFVADDSNLITYSFTQPIENLASTLGIDHQDDTADAAFAIEDLAGGNIALSEEGLYPAPPEPKSLYDFTAQSLICRSIDNLFEESYSELPFLNCLSRRALVDAFLKTVKNRETSLGLLQDYWQIFGWVLKAMPEHSFMREHEIFWNLVESGERDFDPAWLAFLCVMLASALAGQSNAHQFLTADTLYNLSRLALEICDWRRKPCIRTIQCLFQSALYMMIEGNESAAATYNLDAYKGAQSLSLHMLGDDPKKTPLQDRALRAGSLYAREGCVRLWWNIVSSDWLGSPMTLTYNISPKSFTTCRPRNYDDVQLDTADLEEQARPDFIPTSSGAQIGMAETASFCREMVDIGPIPIGGSEIEQYYAKILELDQRYMGLQERYLGKDAISQGPDKQWVANTGGAGFNTRRLRLHRPLMTRGYRDARFAYSTRTCVQCAEAVLNSVGQLAGAKAPTTTIWFLNRHAMTAILAIYIDVFHDVDTGVPWEASEAKLIAVPAALTIFSDAETSRNTHVRAMGRKGRLLIKALDEAKNARRQSRGMGQPENYGQVLKRIASNVKRTEHSPSQSTSNESTPLSTASWLDDADTRRLLSSLGLLDATSGNWLSLQPAVVDDQALWDMSGNGLASQLNGGFDFLDTSF